MKEKKFGLTLGHKIHLFIALTVLVTVFGTAEISYYNNMKQIDGYYKATSKSSAKNFIMMLDPEFLSELKAVVMTDEFAALRDKAEEEDNESYIREYIENAGLWEGYQKTSKVLNEYLDNTDNIKYLYILVLGGEDALQDMFLVDDDESPIYRTGYYEDREEELIGVSNLGEIEPIISGGEWGWLCSAFVPVYDDAGNIVCHVGCDIDMDDVMSDRHRFLIDIMLGALVLTVIAVIISTLLADKVIVIPIRTLTKQMQEFKPSLNGSYEDSGVVHLDINSKDEIRDLYQGIRLMQTEIIDYLKHMFALQKDRERAENDIREKEEQIDRISQDAYKDALTGLGNKLAYDKAVEKINSKIDMGGAAFALIMVDINDLKKINDLYGHESGDEYIKGCARIICDMVPYSPVYRIGGDEFVAILQGTDYVQYEQKAEQIRERYERAYTNKTVSPWLRFSAAVGVAVNTDEDVSFDAVFKRADELMYRLKREFKEHNGSYR